MSRPAKTYHKRPFLDESPLKEGSKAATEAIMTSEEMTAFQEEFHKLREENIQQRLRLSLDYPQIEKNLLHKYKKQKLGAQDLEPTSLFSDTAQEDEAPTTGRSARLLRRKALLRVRRHLRN